MKITSIFQKLHLAEFEDGYYPTTEQFDLIEELSTDYIGEDVCEELVETAPEGTDHNRIAAYLNMLGWESEPLCHATSECIEKWLLEDDTFKIRIALSKELEWSPFQCFTQMESALNRLSKRHPEFQSRCEDLIDSRRNHQSS